VSPRGTHPVLTVAALLAVGLGAAAQAPEPSNAAALRAQLELEERLFEEDVQAYEEARIQQRAAGEEVAAAAEELDAAIAGGTAAVAELERLDMERSVAAAAADIVGRRVEELRRRILERSRRSLALRRALQELGEPRAVGDAISGRWRIEVARPAQPARTGTWELQVEGTVVRGTYSLEAGGGEPVRTGSLRGTYVAGRLNLEQIDSENGLQGTFQGTVDPSLGVARGFWSPADLGGGGPSGNEWSGVRISSPAGEEEEGESG